MTMLLDERRERIRSITENRGFVTLSELVRELDASESTVRRDLEYLDRIGQVRRTRGGAAYVGESITDFQDRIGHASIEKQRIAEATADLIRDEDVILLDGGTTTLEVAKRLVGKSLQVATNSLPIAALLMNRQDIELIFVGGYLYPKTGVALGPHAVAALEKIHVRRLVMSVGGITEEGLFNSNSLLVETERQMIESAEEIIVVCDSSKFGHAALAHICQLNAVHRLVVDSKVSSEWRDVLEASGIELTIASVD